jgi:hypothetical protein
MIRVLSRPTEGGGTMYCRGVDAFALSHEFAQYANRESKAIQQHKPRQLTTTKIGTSKDAAALRAEAGCLGLSQVRGSIVATRRKPEL